MEVIQTESSDRHVSALLTQSNSIYGHSLLFMRVRAHMHLSPESFVWQ